MVQLFTICIKHKQYPLVEYNDVIAIRSSNNIPYIGQDDIFSFILTISVIILP